MIVLGLETATPQVGCALADNDGPMASFHLARGRRHAETLAPAVDYLCREAGIQLGQIGVVAADIGPGLFTGLRVGVATAKTLATALRIPVIGHSSLDLLAYPHRRGGGRIASIVDARRGEVFWAIYRPVPGGVERITDYAVGRPAEVASELVAQAGRGSVLAVGDGARRYAEVFGSLDRVTVGEASSAFPSADVLVELAHPMALREEFTAPRNLAPLYLRQADVRINWAQRDQPPPGGPADSERRAEAG